MENTPRNFALQLGSLITLYVSLTALLLLLSGVINASFPDAADSIYMVEAYSEQIRFSIALLIVFFPAYLVLTRFVNNIRRSEHGTYLTLTKWLIYLSLIVGGGILLGDLVALINAFLNGEITTRFILKTLAFFVVVGAAFVYYLFDAKGYWQKNEKKSLQYGAAALIIVIISIICGFKHIEAPKDVREQKIDNEQISALSNIQSHIEQYYMVNDTLPQSIGEAYDNIAVPQAPEGRDGYTYEATSEVRYLLCAEFAFESDATDVRMIEPIYYDTSIAKQYVTWEHKAGTWCFERSVAGLKSAQ